MPRLTTAKAYVSAIATGVAAALAALAPFVDGSLSVVIFVVLAVMTSYGITYATPNASAGAHRSPVSRTDPGAPTA